MYKKFIKHEIKIECFRQIEQELKYYIINVL